MAWLRIGSRNASRMRFFTGSSPPTSASVTVSRETSSSPDPSSGASSRAGTRNGFPPAGSAPGASCGRSASGAGDAGRGDAGPGVGPGVESAPSTNGGGTRTSSSPSSRSQSMPDAGASGGVEASDGVGTSGGVGPSGGVGGGGVLHEAQRLAVRGVDPQRGARLLERLDRPPGREQEARVVHAQRCARGGCRDGGGERGEGVGHGSPPGAGGRGVARPGLGQGRDQPARTAVGPPGGEVTTATTCQPGK